MVDASMMKVSKMIQKNSTKGNEAQQRWEKSKGYNQSRINIKIWRFVFISYLVDFKASGK